MNEKSYQEIVKLCEEGDMLIQNNEFENAIRMYLRALDRIPTPKSNWEASTWVYAALGDTYFLMQDFKNAKECFYSALSCPNGIDNPFIHLRLGESLFECKEMSKAEEYLLRAYMLEGNKIFDDEEEKYFNAIEHLL